MPGATAPPGLLERMRQAQADGLSPFSALVEVYLAEEHLGRQFGCPVAALAPDAAPGGRGRQRGARLRLSLVERVRRTLPDGADPAQAQAVAAAMAARCDWRERSRAKAGKALLATCAPT